MKKALIAGGFLLVVLVSLVSFVFGSRYQQQRYILEHEKDIAKEQPSPHNGAGMSTGYASLPMPAASNLLFANVF